MNKLSFVEKYRPKTLDEVVLNDFIREKFQEYVDKKVIPNLLFVSPPGQGKTTCAKILTNEITSEYMYINASTQNSIDVIRDKVESFCATCSFTGELKVVILDECLWEEEEVRIGTVDNWEPIKLKNLLKDKTYNVVSLNMETGEFENDTGEIISDKNDEVFEVTLEDGRTINATANHPFLIKDDNGNIIEKKLKDLKENNDIISDENSFNKITKIKSIGTKRVINLTVDKNHTFVTKNGIPTHNCDRLSSQAQQMLRNTLEQFAGNSAFILTCNEANKMNDAVRSRCQEYNFTDNKPKDVILRIVDILKLEKIKLAKPEIKNIKKIVETHFPDIRKCLGVVEQCITNKQFKFQQKFLTDETIITEFIDYIKTKDITSIRENIVTGFDYMAHYKALFNYSTEIKNGEIIMINLGEVIDRHSRSLDPEITFVSFLVSIFDEQ